MLKPLPLVALLLGLLTSQGCGPKESQAPQPLSESSFVSEIETEFAGAADSISGKIATLVTQYEEEEFIEAEGTIDELLYTESKELSKAQAALLGRALITLNKLIGEQASSGDTQAIQEMQRHLLTK